jgi:hypothetical protein
LYSLRARYYDPSDGRFLSRDTWPIDTFNSIELNRYGYTANNPINGFDPSGMNLGETTGTYTTGGSTTGVLTGVGGNSTWYVPLEEFAPQVYFALEAGGLTKFFSVVLLGTMAGTLLLPVILPLFPQPQAAPGVTPAPAEKPYEYPYTGPPIGAVGTAGATGAASPHASTQTNPTSPQPSNPEPEHPAVPEPYPDVNEYPSENPPQTTEDEEEEKRKKQYHIALGVQNGGYLFQLWFSLNRRYKETNIQVVQFGEWLDDGPRQFFGLDKYKGKSISTIFDIAFPLVVSKVEVIHFNLDGIRGDPVVFANNFGKGTFGSSSTKWAAVELYTILNSYQLCRKTVFYDNGNTLHEHPTFKIQNCPESP